MSTVSTVYKDFAINIAKRAGTGIRVAFVPIPQV